MRRYWSPPVVIAVLIVCLLVTFTSLSQTQEKDLRYSYRFGCPDGATSDYCPERYRSLVTDRDTYGVGEKIHITLSNLKDFEYLVEKVEVHFQPIFEHSHELVYVENEVGPISREKNSWVWTWDQEDGAGELVGAGRGYIRITLNCCKNYRTHFRISKGAGTGDISVPTEEEVQIPRPPEALYLQPLSPTEVKLTWNDNSDNEDGFRIYRDGREIATVGPNVTSYTDTELEGNTSYLYRVAAYNEGGESSIGEGLEITTPTAVSSTPISISATPLSPAKVRLTWSDTSDNKDEFRIYRDGNKIATVGPNTTSYVDTELTEDTRYTYRVASYNGAGESTTSFEVKVKTPGEVPAPPTEMRTTTLSATSIALTWNDNSDTEAGFRIYRDGREIATVGPNVTSYVDTGLEDDTSYSYQVSSFNEGGESSLSVVEDLRTPLQAPEAPGRLSSSVLSPFEIKLTWTDNSEDEDGFKIYRNGDRITELNSNRTSYVDTGLAEGTDYTYMISSFNEAGESFITYVLKRATPFEPPPAPDQLVTEPLSPTEVKLTWNDNSDTEAGFRIYRDGREIATVGPNVTSYTDTGLEGNTSCLYRVAAYNEGGESSLTESLEVTTPTEVSSYPTIISANPLSPTEVRLTWGDTSDNEDGFRIYRNGNKIATVGPDTTSYVDIELTEDTRYTYRVASYNQAGESTTSFEVKVKTPGEVPAPPTEMRTTTLSATSIALTWNDNSDSEDGFIVYRDGDKVADLGPNTTTYAHGGLSGDTSYCYEVAAYNSAGESGCTNQSCSMTQRSLPAPPGNLEATPLSPNKISLTWTDNSEDEDGFMVYRDEDVIADLGPNRTSYTDTGLTANETYFYMISSYNSSGESGLLGSGVVKTPGKERDRKSKDLQIPAFNHLLAGVGIVTIVLTYIYQD